MNSDFFKRNLSHIIAFVLFFIVSVGYFYPQLSGKKLIQHDLINYTGASQEHREWSKKHDETTLWTNSSFSGMPTYQMGARSHTNIFQAIHTYVLSFGVGRPISIWLVTMLSFYLMLVIIGVNPWLAIAGSIAYAFSSYNFIVFGVGHAAKVLVLAYWPLVAAGLFLAYTRNMILGAFLFTLGCGLALFANHIQMFYYMVLTLAAFGVSEFFVHLKQGRLPRFAKATGLLVLGGLLALSTSASKLMTSIEFADQTIRGERILADENGEKKSGLDTNYAFEYSQGISECLTFLVPGFKGGANAEPVSNSAATAKFMRGKDKKAPLYWGSLPITAGPIYFGAIVCFLFILGLILAPGRWKWWILVISILGLMLSWGKNFMPLSELFFNYFPLYNKFRAVSSMLVILQFAFPLLAFVGLSQLVNKNFNEKKALTALFIAAGITGGLSLVLALLGPSIFSLSGMNDQAYAQKPGFLEALYADRASLLRSDGLRSFGFIAVAAAVVFLFIKQKIQVLYLGLGLALLMIVDQGLVAKRYLPASSFKSASLVKRQLAATPANTKIKSDPDPHYRVANFARSMFTETHTSFHHHSIGGYDAAKLRRYQDIYDNHIRTNNPVIFNMLNTRYFIIPDRTDPGNRAKDVPKLNPDNCGNAWFVSDIKIVDSAREEIDGLKGFDPKKQAIIHKEFDSYLSGISPDGSGTIKLDKYAPNKLTYSSNSPNEALAVFSEIWYGPNLGWQAYIDGQEVDHIRANYVLRAMKIPAGKHEIVFEFDPQTYRTGELIALIGSILFLIIAVGVGFQQYKSRGREEEYEEADLLNNAVA